MPKNGPLVLNLITICNNAYGGIGVKNLMDKHSIIKLKNEGYYNREVAQMLSIIIKL